MVKGFLLAETILLGNLSVVGGLSGALGGFRMKPAGRAYEAKDLGPLPVEVINATLGTELEPGRARLSRTAHRHMAEDHPRDYPICLAALASAVAAPTFIGQDPSHGGNFVLVKRVGLADGRAVLVAISLEADGQGDYAIRSSYLISARTIDARRAAGRLRIPLRKNTKGPGRAGPLVT